tara:strand:+ start:718 stop:1170 length:453 start_codon:yes stop_codon:yes gene_type:complete
MVNTLKNISAYEGEPPMNLEPRSIDDGPLYAKDKVLNALTRKVVPKPFTKKCVHDLERYSLDLENDVPELIREALTVGRFIGSEWCKGKSPKLVIACDAYSLHRKEWVQYAHKEMCFEYYVKFALKRPKDENSEPELILIASCHLSEERR